MTNYEIKFKKQYTITFINDFFYFINWCLVFVQKMPILQMI